MHGLLERQPLVMQLDHLAQQILDCRRLLSAWGPKVVPTRRGRGEWRDDADPRWVCQLYIRDVEPLLVPPFDRSHHAAPMSAVAPLGWHECGAGSGASVGEKARERVLGGSEVSDVCVAAVRTPVNPPGLQEKGRLDRRRGRMGCRVG